MGSCIARARSWRRGVWAGLFAVFALCDCDPVMMMTPVVDFAVRPVVLDFSVACSAPGVVCTGRCTDVLTDPVNCGGCGHACGQSEVCMAGTCAANCGGGTSPCMGKCVDLQSDPANCGACASVCAMGAACVKGVCGTAFAGSYTVQSGPMAEAAPPDYTCKEACAKVFGGVAGDYTCSTSRNAVDHKANLADISVGNGCIIGGEDQKGSPFWGGQVSQSAWIKWAPCAATNYCFK